VGAMVRRKQGMAKGGVLRQFQSGGRLYRLSGEE
jgi:hypothetical protein